MGKLEPWPLTQFQSNGSKSKYRSPSYWRRQDRGKKDFKLKQNSNSSEANPVSSHSEPKIVVAGEYLPTTTSDLVVEDEATTVRDSKNKIDTADLEVDVMESENSQPTEYESESENLMNKNEVEKFKKALDVLPP